LGRWYKSFLVLFFKKAPLALPLAFRGGDLHTWAVTFFSKKQTFLASGARHVNRRRRRIRRHRNRRRWFADRHRRIGIGRWWWWRTRIGRRLRYLHDRQTARSANRFQRASQRCK
jgi:hypothetical protein